MRYEVKVAPDKMSASLILRDDGVDYEVREEDILKALKDAGVSYGIMMDKIKEIVKNPIPDKPFLVAKGRLPVKGEDGRVELLKKEDGKNVDKKRVDFREFAAKKQRWVVKERDVIGKLIRPGKGIPGINVFGEKIEPKPGNPPKVRIGDGIKVEDDGTLLVTKPGMLIVKNDEIYVEDLLVIKGDVDYSTGNIDFPGTVEINGDVKPGFVVKAKKDIKIKGVVEAATVISFEGSIEVMGVKGQEKGLIRAKEDVVAKFLENAHVEAGKDIVVDGPITNTVAKAKKSIKATGRKGLIVGGVVSATVMVEADEIGSPLGVKTVVEICIDPELRERERLLLAQIKLDEENLEKLLLVMKQLKKIATQRGALPVDKQETYRKVSQTILHLKTMIDQNKKELFNIRKIYENARKVAKIIARKVIHPGVEITMFQKKLVINRPIKAALFVIDDIKDDILIKAYTGGKS